ncbi:Uncharacterised protein [Mycobacteroides abscessus subsp. abscessus]|nr:Uncharacterised protein [Mycobacteroides abscessus subsp. abscessus]
MASSIASYWSCRRATAASAESVSIWLQYSYWLCSLDHRTTSERSSSRLVSISPMNFSASLTACCASTTSSESAARLSPALP